MLLPELLAPAGDFEKLKYAIAYGADAVYCGVPMFSMRARENEFNLDWLQEGVRYCRQRNKKIYFTINVYLRNFKIKPFLKAFEKMRELKPDAFIIADPGLIMLIKEQFPEIELHLSVQQNALNWASAQFWSKQGLQRIILPRELSLEEIKEIIKKNPNADFETFVHGAICVAYSGRCLLSNYLAHRDANQGICAHSCRWNYKLYTQDGSKKIYALENKKLYLEEEKRKGEFMEIDENEHGSFLLSSRDLCALEFLKDLWQIGIKSFKIEGRNKTTYYLAIITRAYRSAIDAITAKQKPDYIQLFTEIFSTANRGFIPGFLRGDLGSSTINYSNRASEATHEYSGIVRSFDQKTKFLEIEPKNRICVGDEVEFCLPNYKNDFKLTITQMNFMNDEDTKIAHGGDKNIYLKMPDEHLNKFNGENLFSVIRKKI